MKACLSHPEQPYNSSMVGRTAIKPREVDFQRASEGHRESNIVSRVSWKARRKLRWLLRSALFCLHLNRVSGQFKKKPMLVFQFILECVSATLKFQCKTS